MMKDFKEKNCKAKQQGGLKRNLLFIYKIKIIVIGDKYSKGILEDLRNVDKSSNFK